MKKKVLTATILSVAALALVGGGTAYAHGWFGFMSGTTPEEFVQKQQNIFQQQADILGINIDAVKNGWTRGQSLQEIAEANGISESDLQAKFEEAATLKISERLQALVDQGVITQSQANQRLQFEERSIDSGNGMGFGKYMMGYGHCF